MAKIFAFPNLAAPICRQFDSVSECIAHFARATEQTKDSVRAMPKPRRRDWMKDAASTWPCISFVEGLNPHQRVGHDNPPHLLHGIAADFDNVGKSFTEQELADLASRCAYPPAAGGKSLGGGYHFIWLFEEPIQLLSNEAYATKIIKAVFSKIRVGNLMVGFDEACRRPTQLLSIDPHEFGWLTDRFETGCIEAVATRIWSGEVDVDFEFDGVALDLDEVKAQVDRIYPGRWAGPFVAGARGIRFWDATATDPTAAVVTATGMRYFSDGGGFKTWAQIFGSDFVEKLSINTIKTLTDDFYYTKLDREYVQFLRPLNEYRTLSRTQMLSRFRAAGLDKQEDQDRAFNYIEDYRAVDATVEMANQTKGVVKQGAITVINMDKSVPPPCKEGDFEFLRVLITEAMFPGDQHHYLLAWLKDAAKSVMTLTPTFSQVIFMAGDVSLGKSLLQKKVFTPMFGGVEADPIQFFLGRTTFNSQLSGAGHWCISDAPGATNANQKSEMTQQIKAVAANGSHSSNAKFKVPITVSLNSRVTFSLNKVTECLSVFPKLGPDILDKLILLDVKHHTFLPRQDGGYNAVCAEALPGFVYWLLNQYEPPRFALGTSRFYAASYHNDELLTYTMAAQDNSELLNLVHLAFRDPAMAEYASGAKQFRESSAGWLRLFTVVLGGRTDLSQRQITSMFNGLSRQYPDAVVCEYDSVARHFKYSVDYSKFS